MVNRQQCELLDWLGESLVTQGDVADHFRLHPSDASKLIKSLIALDLIEPSGSHRKASNGYPMILYQRTELDYQLAEDAPSRPIEWRPLWNQMGLGEYASLSGTPTVHRLED